jgi:hypothetical protein
VECGRSWSHFNISVVENLIKLIVRHGEKFYQKFLLGCRRSDSPKLTTIAAGLEECTPKDCIAVDGVENCVSCSFPWPVFFFFRCGRSSQLEGSHIVESHCSCKKRKQVISISTLAV